VLLFFAYVFPVIFISYLFCLFRNEFRTCGFVVQCPLFAPLRQKCFPLKLTLNSSTVGAPELLPVFFSRHTLRFYTEGCCSPSLILSSSVTESFVLSLPQIDSIAQVLLSCANITRTHFIIGVKSSHCFQSHILWRPRHF
jgi:hypothetical protein